MAQIIKAEFSHVANAESGWYVEIQGTHEEVMGDAGLSLAESSAREAGWDGDRARAGYPSSHNLREDRRCFWFYGQSLWVHHLECWCRHQFCPHTQGWGQGGRCTADAPYRKEEVTA